MPLLNEANTIRQLEFPKDSFRRVNLKDGIYNHVLSKGMVELDSLIPK